MRSRCSCLVAVGLLVLAASAAAQAPSLTASRGVPALVRFTGTIDGAQGAMMVTFALYAEQTGGTPLWVEAQNIVCEPSGRYSVALGGATPGGLPPDLFATGEGRWIGVQPAGWAELPRIALVSVPYAARAATADTIAGKPAAAFVQVGDRTGVGADGVTYINPQLLANGFTAALGATAGSEGHIGKFSSTGDLIDSAIHEDAAGWIGVNTNAPAAPFHVAADRTPSSFFDVYSGGGVLGQLPVVNRAARGTVATPGAVQTEDILGGLAVRAFDGTQFSGGQGQVMFRAAEPWTDTAHGTYLQMTTTPLGSVGWLERLRIDPAGNVGIGTTTPTQKLSVAGIIESITGGFKFPDGSVTTGLASNPQFGNGVVVDSYSTNAGTVTSGAVRFGGGNTGEAIASRRTAGTNQYGLDFYTNFTPRISVTVAGNVGIGTRSPTMPLHVKGHTRVEGTARIGVESIGEPPAIEGSCCGYAGLVLRRLNTSDATAGAIVAKAEYVVLERDGTEGGFNVRVTGYYGNTLDVNVACMGVNASGASVNKVLALYGPTDPTPLYATADNVVYLHCSFGYPSVAGQATEVTLFRKDLTGTWVGTLTSTWNQ